MNTAIVVTVNLPGALLGPVKHTTKQVGRVDVSPVGSKKPEWITRRIKHTDRPVGNCTRVFPLPAETVKAWTKHDAPAPYWVKPQIWKKLSEEQKLMAMLSRYDEGYGVSYS